jgi:hypothetical protein
MQFSYLKIIALLSIEGYDASCIWFPKPRKFYWKKVNVRFFFMYVTFLYLIVSGVDPSSAKQGNMKSMLMGDEWVRCLI